ncbi:MAG: hypothetical protein HRT57_03585 [Crocinitomicaceae bacterium]|nr:hypothetical protein [Crocinitomicaceae bacterium]
MSCTTEDDDSDAKFFEVSCDAETVEGDNFVKNGVKFKGAWLQSSKYARSGKHSVKLNPKGQFGFSYEIKNIKKGDIIEASIWKHVKGVKGSLVISSDDPKVEHYLTGRIFGKIEGDWGQYSASYIAQEDCEKVLVYAFNGSQEDVYFDDIKIKIYRDNPKPDDSHQALEINITSSLY